MFKYAAAHNGIDALACYGMDIAPDTRMVTNPARISARNQVKTAEADLAAAERALPQLLNSGQTPKQLNAALPGLHQRIDHAAATLAHAKAALGRSQPRSPPPSWTRTRNAPAPTWPAAACKWCSGSSRSTPKPGSPTTSTPT